MRRVSSSWIPESLASIPWVVPLFNAIQSGKISCAFRPWIKKSASSGVDRPSLPLISPTSVSSPAHFGTQGFRAMLASRLRSSGMWDASMAMEVMPASNIEGISVRAASTSMSVLIP